MSRILLIEKDPSLQRSLTAQLKAQEYDVICASGGNDALSLAVDAEPDLVIMEIDIEQICGLDVIAALRGWSHIPIVVLSRHDDESTKVRALDAGANDYVSKPFSLNELFARLRAALRNNPSPTANEPVHTEDFYIDLLQRKVVRNGKVVHVTATEWGIIELLVTHPSKLITHRELLQKVWGPAYGSESHYLRVYMSSIRRKLEPDPSNPRYFVTETGLGYRFQPGVRPTFDLGQNCC